MKKFIHSSLVLPILAVLLFLSSCTGGDRDIFRIMPEETAGVVTFNPKNLVEKGKLGELDFIKEAVNNNKVIEKIINDPKSTGIRMSSYSAFFVFDKNPSFGCLVVPLDNKSDFRSFLADIEKEADTKFEEGDLGSYKSLKLQNVVIAWNNKVAFVLSSFSGWGGNGIDSVALALTKTKRSESLLTDKDFNKFLVRQRDINAWLTSTNLASMGNIGEMGGMIDLFGGLKNNYGHFFVEFQKGAMSIVSNLRLNASMKETIDKYNFLDRDAGKVLLKYLPAKDVFFVGNTNVDPEKLLSLMQFINKQAGSHIGALEKKFGLNEDDLKKAFQGEVAFSVNGIRKGPSMKESDIYGDSSFSKNIPVFVGAVRLQNEKAWTILTQKLEEETGITQKNGYYSLAENFAPVFMTEKDKNVIISNSEDYIVEIVKTGEIKDNVTGTSFADILTKDPICFYVNLDAKNYSKEMQDYIEERMGSEVNMGIESFGKSLKSLSVTANLEEWEFRIELNNTEENSLYALLKDL